MLHSMKKLWVFEISIFLSVVSMVAADGLTQPEPQVLPGHPSQGGR